MSTTASIQPSFPEIRGAMFEQAERTVYAKFLYFHTRYPQIYLWFERYALELIRQGQTKLGAKMIIERVRWEVAMAVDKTEHSFKIDNNYICHYARLFTKNHPEYLTFFEFRALRVL